jgi:hypothetical protein
MIIAIDPGAMCGAFYFEPRTGEKHSFEVSPFTLLSGFDTLTPAPDVHLVTERYNITAATIKMSRQYDALETNGALRYFARKHGWKFTPQNRADRSRVSDEVLKHIGWFNPTKDGHANDAARHCFVALAREYPNHSLVLKSLDMV